MKTPADYLIQHQSRLYVYQTFAAAHQAYFDAINSPKMPKDAEFLTQRYSIVRDNPQSRTATVAIFVGAEANPNAYSLFRGKTELHPRVDWKLAALWKGLL